MAKLEITLKRSVIGRPEDQRITVRTLGLKKQTKLSFMKTTLQSAVWLTKYLI